MYCELKRSCMPSMLGANVRLCTLYESCLPPRTSHTFSQACSHHAHAPHDHRHCGRHSLQVDRDGTVMGEEDDSSSSGDESDDAMEEAGGSAAAPAARPAPIVDEEGFTMVQKGGRRGR